MATLPARSQRSSVQFNAFACLFPSLSATGRPKLYSHTQACILLRMMLYNGYAFGGIA